MVLLPSEQSAAGEAVPEEIVKIGEPAKGTSGFL